MSFWLFVETNAKFVTSVLSVLGVAGTSGIVYVGNVGEDKSEYILREVPEIAGANHLKVMDGKSFKDANLVKYSYKSLLAGDPGYNSGNYVIYYGSQACPHCTKFIYGSQEIARGNIWYKRDLMSEGAWMKAYNYVHLDKDIQVKPKFIMYEDIPAVPENAVDDSHWNLPWLTWEKTDLEKGQVLGEYVRNDKSARDFRKVMDMAVKLFGHDKVGGTPTVIVYKKGVPKIFGRDKLPGLDDSVEYSRSVDLELRRYIKYYYQFIK